MKIKRIGIKCGCVVDFSTFGCDLFKMYPVFIQDQNGENKFREIKEKILDKEEVELTKEERLYLIYNPLMDKNATPDARTQEIVELVSKMKVDQLKFSLLGTLAVMTKNFISEDTKQLIWEAMEMTAVFEKQLKELNEQRDLEKLEEALRELYAEDLTQEEIAIEERGIKRALKVPERMFQEVKARVKNDRVV